MKNIRIYRCEDSIDGIFTAVYNAWASQYGHDYIKIEVLNEDQPVNMELFSEYISVNTDTEKSKKVARSIRQKISVQAYEMVIQAGLSNDVRKANCIYHFLVRGFAMGAKVVDHLTDTYVSSIFEINRNVGNELHHYKGFLRFKELSNGIFLAKFEPKNSIVELIMPHFTDRLSEENFIILDVKRRLAAIHQKGYQWVMTKIDKETMDELIANSDKEEEYQSLWKAFFKSIAIAERENYNCQRNNAPLHYRKYMFEFDQK